MSKEAEGAYSLRQEADRIFRDVLLKDERLQLPSKVVDLAAKTSFEASDALDSTYLPVPLKFTETSAALWALAATLGNAIVKDRFGVEQNAEVNIDVASLFLVSAMIAKVNGKAISDPEIVERWIKYDLKGMSNIYRGLCTNVYPTKDGRWFHLHGSMDSDRSLAMLGLPKEDVTITTQEEAIKLFSETVRKYDADWLDAEANQHWRQAGTICLTQEEFEASEQGKATADESLYTLRKSDAALPPVPYPSADGNNRGSKRRPLEGIKMLDISRVIAAPTIAKLAACFGATVVRVSCGSQPEVGPLLLDGNLGKRDATLDLKSDTGRRQLARLVEDADVVLDGYRPGALERLGFGVDYLHTIARRRGRGIVVVRENCYGWAGPWAGRSGWQQIADCVTGVSWEMGKFLGLDEPVVPPFPNSDYQTGLTGLLGILTAIDKRATEGGSYTVDVSLTSYDRFLLAQGAYNPELQQYLREIHPEFRPRHYDNMSALIGQSLGSLRREFPELFRRSYFADIASDFHSPDGKPDVLTYLVPAASYGVSRLGYDVGSCLPGAHEPIWPVDETSTVKS